MLAAGIHVASVNGVVPQKQRNDKCVLPDRRRGEYVLLSYLGSVTASVAFCNERETSAVACASNRRPNASP